MSRTPSSLSSESVEATEERVSGTSLAGLTPFEQGVIDIFVRLADTLGLPKSVGEIYGLLFASARPLALQDIIDRLQISKGSASQGLRLLRSNGAIRLIYMPADRRDYYEPETELRALVGGFLREKIQPHLDSGSVRLEALQSIARTPALGVKDAAEAKVLRGRLEKLSSWHRKGKAVVPLVTKFFS